MIIEQCRKILGRSGKVGILLLDLSKSHDCILQDLLKTNLEAYGFGMESLNLMHSYLTNRLHRIKANGTYSKRQQVKSGCPTGLSSWAFAVQFIY